MKKILSLLVLSTFFFASCSKDKKDEDTSVQQLKDKLDEGGIWYVSSFIEDDIDETNDFGGYRFSFDKDTNTVTVTKALSDGASGDWSVTSNSGTKLILDFNDLGDLDNLEELNEDWKVLEITEHEIKLEHVSGGDGHVDSLTFSNNIPV